MSDLGNNASDNTETGEQAASAADSGTSPEFVTSDQLQDFGKDLMGNIRKTMAGMMKTQSQPPTAKPPTQEAQPQNVDVASILRQERTTERAIVKHGLDEHQGDFVRQLMETQKPDDANAFIENFAKTMGIAPGALATQTPEATAPNPNPASDGGTPGMTPTLESDDQPVWKWSDEKVAKFIKEKGHREFASLMKTRLPKDLKGVRFHIPRS